MQEMRLFYTPVWRSNLADSEPTWPELRAIMLDRIFALEGSDEGVTKSNFGGWQSGDDVYRYPEFGWLISRVMALANEVAPAFSSTHRFSDGILWANVNRRGSFNAIHTHPDAILSGAAYLKVDGEAQGVIQFLDAREGNPTTHWRCFMNLNEATPLTEEAVTIVPREGDILLFPGWVKHWVTPNETDEARVTVAFNIRMNPGT